MRIDSELLAWLAGYCHKTGNDRTLVVTTLLEALRDNRATITSPEVEPSTSKYPPLDFSGMNVIERYEAKSKFDERWNEDPSGCWIWHTPSTAFYWRGKAYSAPRFSLAFHEMAIPEGMFACHTCDNRRCVNPKHLWVGSAYENVRDMINKGRQYQGPNWVAPIKDPSFRSPNVALAFPASHTEEEIQHAVTSHNKRGT